MGKLEGNEIKGEDVIVIKKKGKGDDSSGGRSMATIAITNNGVVADDPAAATDNVIAFRQLVSLAVDGGKSSYEGRILFPGPATYYFDNVITFRDHIHLDLQGSTLHFNKVADQTDACSGFLFAIRNFSVKNGSIVVDYDNTPGIVQGGSAIQFGSRGKSGSTYFPNLYDSKLESPMGNLLVRNIDITVNHQGTSPSYGILMFGGLDHVLLKNVSVDGQGSLYAGIFYEFGTATVQTDPNAIPKPDPWKTSHARYMTFRDISVANLSPTGMGAHPSVALHIGGASDTLVDGLYVNGAGQGFSSTHGEAAYYNTWRELPEVPTITLRNIKMQNIYDNGLNLVGASLFKGGYLGDFITNPTPEDQSDHLDYIVEGFNIQGAENNNRAGIYVSGRRLELCNGTITGFKWGILSNNDCTQFAIDNVQVLDSAWEGINLSYENGVWPSPRFKTGHIIKSFLAGGGTDQFHPHAILLNHVSDFLIEGNTFGYSIDPTQGNAVCLMAHAQHVVVYDNTVVSTLGCYYSASLAKNNILQANHGNVASVGIWQHATDVYPILVMDLVGQSVPLGSNVTLEAVFSGDVTRYTWLKDGIIFTYSDSGSVTLAMAEPEDFGYFQVIAKNGALDTASSVVEVRMISHRQRFGNKGRAEAMK